MLQDMEMVSTRLVDVCTKQDRDDLNWQVVLANEIIIIWSSAHDNICLLRSTHKFEVRVDVL